MDMLREVLKKEVNRHRPTWQHRNMTVMERLMIADPKYAEEVKAAERFWLDSANEILCEIIDELRRKIKDPLTTMSDLVKALDVLSEKYSLYMGMPTSIGYNYVKELDDESLDRRIDELRSHFLPSPNHEQYALEGTIITEESEKEEEKVSPPIPSPINSSDSTLIHPLTDEHTAPLLSEEKGEEEKEDGIM